MEAVIHFSKLLLGWFTAGLIFIFSVLLVWFAIILMLVTGKELIEELKEKK